MNPTSHRAVTIAAVECLAKLEPKNGNKEDRFVVSGTNLNEERTKKILAVADSQSDGHAPEFEGEKYKDYDVRNELSFIDINGAGTATDDALDDPHHDELFESPDKCEKEGAGSHFSAYNHFIDIGKGKGIFDDYDGYSYNNGSGSVDEYETLHDAVPYFTSDSTYNFLNEFGELITKNMKTDEALAWYFNDSNVEYPGSKWYCNCSPALWNYSYPPASENKYNELSRRFPWGKYGTEAYRRNKNGCVPWSVFMPVDNLGRYWYETFLMSRTYWDLGPVLHAVQDACVPHHAAGHMGNYHAKYEKYLESYLYEKEKGTDSWADNDTLRAQAIALFDSFNYMDSPPSSLTYPQDLTAKKPNLTWSVDQIITWAAFNAYYEYKNTYNSFKSLKNIDEFKAATAKKLFVLSLALSMLILKKAQVEAIDIPMERQVTTISIESIELSSEQEIMLCINQGSMNFMVGGSMEFGSKRDVPYKIKKGSFTIDVSKHCIDAAYMLLSIKKCSSKELNIKNLSVSYKTRDGVTHYYTSRHSTEMVLNSMFQMTISHMIPSDTALPMALNVSYPDNIKDMECVDKVRIYLEVGDDKDAGSSHGLKLRLTGNGINPKEYTLFENGLTHGTKVQKVIYLLKEKIKSTQRFDMELVNTTENAVYIKAVMFDFLDGYSNTLLGNKLYPNMWIAPGKTDTLSLGFFVAKTVTSVSRAPQSQSSVLRPSQSGSRT